jgi:ketol-acid reductoisomerase
MTPKPTYLLTGGIAVIGYGNQGCSQALNLRDSGLSVSIGNQVDNYAEQACAAYTWLNGNEL